jgi:hypothetical protein
MAILSMKEVMVTIAKATGFGGESAEDRENEKFNLETEKDETTDEIEMPGSKVRRSYQDSVFKMLFGKGETAATAELLSDLTGEDVPESEIKYVTISDALALNMADDLAVEIYGRFLILTEHQSTKNMNMPVRMLMYTGRIYEGYFARRKLAGEIGSIYDYDQIKIPRPEFVVIYTGLDEWGVSDSTLHLEDAYFEKAKHAALGSLSLDVHVYDATRNMPERFREGGYLAQYVTFIERVKANKAAGMKLDVAVKKAIEDCIKDGILKDFLERRGNEVNSVLAQELRDEDFIQIGERHGLKKGLEKGLEIGRLEEKRAITRSLLTTRMPISEIATVTGFSIEEIEAIKRSN